MIHEMYMFFLVYKVRYWYGFGALGCCKEQLHSIAVPEPVQYTHSSVL